MKKAWLMKKESLTAEPTGAEEDYRSRHAPG